MRLPFFFINFLQFVKPICIPQDPNNDPDKYSGHLVHVIGWGSSTDINAKSSSQLKRADIALFSQRLDLLLNFN